MKMCVECAGNLVVLPLDVTTKHASCDGKDCLGELGDTGTAWTCGADNPCDFDLCSDCYGANGVVPPPEGNSNVAEMATISKACELAVGASFLVSGRDSLNGAFVNGVCIRISPEGEGSQEFKCTWDLGRL